MRFHLYFFVRHLYLIHIILLVINCHRGSGAAVVTNPNLIRYITDNKEKDIQKPNVFRLPIAHIPKKDHAKTTKTGMPILRLL